MKIPRLTDFSEEAVLNFRHRARAKIEAGGGGHLRIGMELTTACNAGEGGERFMAPGGLNERYLAPYAAFKVQSFGDRVLVQNGGGALFRLPRCGVFAGWKRTGSRSTTLLMASAAHPL